MDVDNETLNLSGNPVQCSLQVGRVSVKQIEKFQYLGVASTSDGVQDKEWYVQSGKASAVIFASFIYVKMEAIENGNTVGVLVNIHPYPAYKSLVMTKRVQSQMCLKRDLSKNLKKLYHTNHIFFLDHSYSP